MTPSPLIPVLLPLLDDLARDMPQDERYSRLLQALQQLMPCDAIALLRLEDEQLVPLAVRGLSADALGRRFRLDEHPRLAALLDNGRAMRFAADCTLPDPYDGLVEGPHPQLAVHDCLGCPLYIDERPWGLLTLDALDARCFGRIALDQLDAVARLAAATVKAGERLSSLQQRADDQHRLAESYRQVAGQVAPRELIGNSAAMQRLQEEISLLGKSELPVLISGETGVGKELVALAIQRSSPRAGKPLISINCAALPETLVESELFGHVRGAFSGAHSERRGKFELAHGGTLFLDEVGELPLSVQAKLLRVLQSGQLQRVGSDREHQVDVRVLAASNRNLPEEVQAGRLRADLYHRLSAYPLHVPPLRERGRDVLLLAGFFLEQNRPRLHLRGLCLSLPAHSALLAHHWPGNVRELEHLIGRAALKALGRQRGERPDILSIEASDLDLPHTRPCQPCPADPPMPAAPIRDLRQAVDDYQRQLLSGALQRQQGNWAAVARELRVDRANLHRLAQRLGLKD